MREDILSPTTSCKLIKIFYGDNEISTETYNSNIPHIISHKRANRSPFLVRV